MPVYCYDRDHLEVLTIVRTNTDQCIQHHHHRIYRQRKCHTNINLVSRRWFATPELETCSVLRHHDLLINELDQRHLDTCSDWQ